MITASVQRLDILSSDDRRAIRLNNARIVIGRRDRLKCATLVIKSGHFAALAYVTQRAERAFVDPDYDFFGTIQHDEADTDPIVFADYTGIRRKGHWVILIPRCFERATPPSAIVPLRSARADLPIARSRQAGVP